YNLYLVSSTTCDTRVGTRVLFEGKEVGRVDGITSLDSNRVVLTLQIENGVKIARNSDINCVEKILGDVVIEILQVKKDKGVYLEGKDTLYAGVTLLPKRVLDSAAREIITGKLKDLKQAVDSIVMARNYKGLVGCWVKQGSSDIGYPEICFNADSTAEFKKGNTVDKFRVKAFEGRLEVVDRSGEEHDLPVTDFQGNKLLMMDAMGSRKLLFYKKK
ncbi:MAG TPA: MlaD family protein, partial [Puia sp.]